MPSRAPFTTHQALDFVVANGQASRKVTDRNAFGDSRDFAHALAACLARDYRSSRGKRAPSAECERAHEVLAHVQHGRHALCDQEVHAVRRVTPITRANGETSQRCGTNECLTVWQCGRGRQVGRRRN
ncbi:hypothetical protein [Paraburkholderia sp. J41]|uniref:hypothetical protein n=1 Tax=Paraburkholderia sp. J41 TaxID=2805433 RepID=UPI002AC32F35|nr:hypothetical protein [Paraburkholderia sp. J41]